MTIEETITVKEARTRYKLTEYKMTTLIHRKVINAWDNPRDARSKIVSVAELEAYVNTPKIVETMTEQDIQELRDRAIIDADAGNPHALNLIQYLDKCTTHRQRLNVINMWGYTTSRQIDIPERKAETA